MASAEAKETAPQLLLPSTKRFRSKPASRSTAMKKAKDESVLPAISLNLSDGLTVLYGQPHATHIALQALVDHALTGHPVVYLDGLHTFDAILIGRLARHRRQQPRKALSMIHVARVFSAKQLERLLSHCLVDALERYQARTAVISGLLETLSSDCLTDHEINRLTDRMIESIRHVTSQGFSLLCPCPSVPSPMAPSHRLFATLCSLSHRCIDMTPSPSNPAASELQLSPEAQLDRVAVS